jgi:hypothetical protein
MKRILLPGVLLFGLVFAGCAQVQVLTVNSMEKDKEFYKGREISYKANEDAATEMEVDGVNDGKIYFYLFIRNKSEQTIEIRPEKIYLNSYNSLQDLDEGKGVKHWVYDPEIALDEIKENMDKARNWKNAATGLNCCLSVFSFISHISSDDDYEAIDAVDDAGGFVVRQSEIESDYKGEMGDLHSEKEFWGKEVLRRTVLKPKDEIGGIIVMPMPEDIKYMRVTIPFEKTDHTYQFELKKMKRR